MPIAVCWCISKGGGDTLSSYEVILITYIIEVFTVSDIDPTVWHLAPDQLWICIILITALTIDVNKVLLDEHVGSTVRLKQLYYKLHWWADCLYANWWVQLMINANTGLCYYSLGGHAPPNVWRGHHQASEVPCNRLLGLNLRCPSVWLCTAWILHCLLFSWSNMHVLRLVLSASTTSQMTSSTINYYILGKLALSCIAIHQDWQHDPSYSVPCPHSSFTGAYIHNQHSKPQGPLWMTLMVNI